MLRVLFLWPGVVDVAGDAGVRTKGSDRGAKEGLFEDGCGIAAMSEGESLISKYFIGVKEDGLVDEVLTKDGSVEVRPSLEKNTEDLPFSEQGEEGWEREAASVLGDYLNLCSISGKAFNLPRWRGGAGEDKQVAVGRAHELRVARDAQVRVEYGAKKRPATRLFRAVGEQGVIGKHGPNTCEDGI
jgi:hypothetical protein